MNALRALWQAMSRGAKAALIAGIVLTFALCWIITGLVGRSSAPVQVTEISVPGPTQLVPVPVTVQVPVEVPVTVMVEITSTPADTPTPPAVAPTATPIYGVPTAAAPATNTPSVPSGPTTTGYVPFTPDWAGLSTNCPDKQSFLVAHGLTEAQVIFHPAPSVSWEPCEFVIELRPEFYGQITIPLINGYAYTLAPVGDVTNMWGGDPLVTVSTLQWGFTARWAQDYQDLPYKWLDPANPCEWLVRDWRFGRYWRLPNLGLTPPEVPYYGRLGPYRTLPGNVSCTGWIPPELDQTVPKDFLQAAAMLGGLANANEWKHSDDGLNWAWRYSQKVAGSANYCPSGMPCWQTTYIPPNSRGYIELWDGTGPRKFFAAGLPTLMLGNKNVDEFTFHGDPNR